MAQYSAYRPGVGANITGLEPAAGLPVRTSPSDRSTSYSRSATGDLPSSPLAATPMSPRDALQRSTSTTSTKVDPTVARSATFKSRNSVRRHISRRSSRRSMRAGAMQGLGDGDESEFNNVFHTPIPTTGNPTEILSERFQAWRKLLKDLITYFREIQAAYEHRSKALLKVSNVVNNTTAPPLFLSEGGLEDALGILRKFHKQAITEANKSRDIENDVITQLNGLRSDLSQKIKEIKSLSGDFKNSVDKEKEGTRKAVEALKDALQAVESDPTSATGKNDPFIVRLHAEKQVERQIEEENYLHRAYLNLEGSGRELESIVIGEIQKAYNAFAGILKRESDNAHEAIEDLRAGPIAMPKDHEWNHFVEHDSHFIDPAIPLRKIHHIYYPGKYNPAALEIRAGMLERKSKYLKSYTPGWYVLSATHLHEFKSADHLYTQAPVMSLQLLDQKLGSRSQPGASSHKFSLKGKQTGGLHRGHSWVFRAESYDTMMAWYEDIRNLTENTMAERNAFVKRHARSISGGSHPAPSISSDGLRDDEADEAPYAGTEALPVVVVEAPYKRPEPGGRFPSDLNLDRRLQAPLPPSSGSSSNASGQVVANGAIAAAAPPSAVVHIAPQHAAVPAPVPASFHAPAAEAIPVGTERALPAVAAVNLGNVRNERVAAPIQHDMQSSQSDIRQGPYQREVYGTPAPAALATAEHNSHPSGSLPGLHEIGDSTTDARPVINDSKLPMIASQPAPAAVGASVATVLAAVHANSAPASAPQAEPASTSAAIAPVESIQSPRPEPTPAETQRLDYFASSPAAMAVLQNSAAKTDEQGSGSGATTPTAESVRADGADHARRREQNTVRQSTATTISDLHIPGEFPGSVMQTPL